MNATKLNFQMRQLEAQRLRQAAGPRQVDVEPTELKAPFPYFGGKRRCAHIVWQRFGNVPNYVEPFFGSGAVLLGRPHPPRTETINDLDCYVANFWRAVQAAPGMVAAHCDWPVNEADLHARHRWLVEQQDFRERMKTDPHFYDARVAGWWVWGISQWIGSGWCSRPEWMGRTLPGRAPRGIHSNGWKARPMVARGGNGIHRKRVNLKRGGIGVHARFLDRRMPDLGGNAGATGKGVVRSGLRQKIPTFKRAAGSGVLRSEYRQLPQLSGDGSGHGRGVHRPVVTENLHEYMHALRERLRHVRVCCGDWQRVLGRSPTECIGITAIFLDPPYSAAANRDPSIYAHDDPGVAKQVAAWALAHGDNPKLRIAFCGYEGEHKFPKRWSCVPWKANGGYGNQAAGQGRDNANRERIWFSPHCLKPQTDWFA